MIGLHPTYLKSAMNASGTTQAGPVRWTRKKPAPSEIGLGNFAGSRARDPTGL
jgi:hypothetical protein